MTAFSRNGAPQLRPPSYAETFCRPGRPLKFSQKVLGSGLCLEGQQVHQRCHDGSARQSCHCMGSSRDGRFSERCAVTFGLPSYAEPTSHDVTRPARARPPVALGVAHAAAAHCRPQRGSTGRCRIPLPGCCLRPRPVPSSHRIAVKGQPLLTAPPNPNRWHPRLRPLLCPRSGPSPPAAHPRPRPVEGGMGHGGARLYQRRGRGGGGLRPKSGCTKKEPNKTFPTVNFVLSRNGPFGLGGGVPPPPPMVHGHPNASPPPGGGGPCPSSNRSRARRTLVFAVAVVPPFSRSHWRHLPEDKCRRAKRPRSTPTHQRSPAVDSRAPPPTPEGMHWKGGRYPPPLLQGPQPMPSHCPPDAKWPAQSHW